MRIVIIFILVSIFSGCTKKIYVPVSRSTTIIDTVTNVVADSSLLYAYFECDSLNNVRIAELSQVKGAMASQEVEFKQNRLKVETKWKTKFVDRVEKRVDTVTIVDIVVQERVVAKIPTFFWITFFGSIFGLVYIFWKISRKIW